ncbi:DNA glycosylase/AP lyase ROS1 [Juglans microcarpa x Juglans regia]|uniref:DNA glycosylase/AP lyase ROS1 n=1 Tax=Juglans microcarpa x Juglans regia TaxID=2249226 RepID=UPI001B7EF43D|nr:DNA glycosylase/AP lyase ROS1 [Juglans microcarpa x Juglans regia]
MLIKLIVAMFHVSCTPSLENFATRKHAFVATVLENRTPTQFEEQFWGIPSRTAMKGRFPLNGTYIQVNEVFAYDETSQNPIHVPREWIWHLERRTAYFASSATAVFRGLSADAIRSCKGRVYLCERI